MINNLYHKYQAYRDKKFLSRLERVINGSTIHTDKKLRMELVKQSGFSLDEVQLVYAFINGSDEALSELKEFRQWKISKEKQRLESTL